MIFFSTKGPLLVLPPHHVPLPVGVVVLPSGHHPGGDGHGAGVPVCRHRCHQVPGGGGAAQVQGEQKIFSSYCSNRMKLPKTVMPKSKVSND